eukprot:2929326-Rhodomonas_salina.2
MSAQDIASRGVTRGQTRISHSSGARRCTGDASTGHRIAEARRVPQIETDALRERAVLRA